MLSGLAQRFARAQGSTVYQSYTVLNTQVFGWGYFLVVDCTMLHKQTDCVILTHGQSCHSLQCYFKIT